MIPLKDVQRILAPYGYRAEPASADHYPLLERDLDAADKYELGRTRHQDWRAELRATLANSATTFLVTSAAHGGALIFGVTPFAGHAGRVWMLQSATFAAEARKVHGPMLVHRIGAMTRAVIALFLTHHCPLFNFIPAGQVRNIRWLKQGGFGFFGRTDIDTDILFFGQGAGWRELALDGRLWVSCLGPEILRAAPRTSDERPGTATG